jgi:hypothetical protein
MNQDDLQHTWEGTPTPHTNIAALRSIMRRNSHPVLRRMRTQLLVELVAFSLVLIFYYSAFDGNEKSWWANAVFMCALTIDIAQQIVGLWFSRQVIGGDNIHESLRARVKKMKAYSRLVVGCRALTVTGLLVFFCSVMRFTTFKYGLLAGLVSVMVVQLVILGKVWNKRVSELQKTCDSFMAP